MTYFPSWIRIRICILNEDPDPDPGGKMNADTCESGSTALQIRIRIQKIRISDTEFKYPGTLCIILIKLRNYLGMFGHTAWHISGGPGLTSFEGCGGSPDFWPAGTQTPCSQEQAPCPGTLPLFWHWHGQCRSCSKLKKENNYGVKIKYSVLDPFPLNPDPAKNLNPDPDPSYFFTLSEKTKITSVLRIRFYHQCQLKDRML